MSTDRDVADFELRTPEGHKFFRAECRGATRTSTTGRAGQKGRATVQTPAARSA